MKKYLDLPDIDVYICSSENLSGKEKEMVESIKTYDAFKIRQGIVKLNAKQIVIFDEKLKNINRFYEILEFESIGIKTYSKLFEYSIIKKKMLMKIHYLNFCNSSVHYQSTTSLKNSFKYILTF